MSLCRIRRNMKDKFFRLYFLLTVAFFAGICFADFIDEYRGILTIGAQDHTASIKFKTDAASQMDLDDGVLKPTTDNDIDLGTSTLEFKDAYFDGTVTLDALSMPMSVVAGANTACSTTCTGLCMFGVNTAATEADIVNCADATADECLCVE
jgi:hypothetical protein